jgi:arylsulfatase A-like enzyme
VHFNVPHEPLFYDASTGRYDLGEKPVLSMFKKDFARYFDAVQLVDRTIGQVRRTMEASGVWDSTHVLITSDHPYRARQKVDGIEDDFRVPFILKTAGGSAGITYETDFNTMVAADLATALLRREVRSRGDLKAWLDQHVKTH